MTLLSRFVDKKIFILKYLNYSEGLSTRYKLLFSSILILVLCSFLINSAVASSVIWNQTYEIDRTQKANSMIETSDGGYALAGMIISFFTGKTVIWVAKADMQGEIPEFPAWIILPLFIMATLFAILIKKKLF